MTNHTAPNNGYRATVRSLSPPPPPSSGQRLELVEQPSEVVPHPGGAVACDKTVWIRAERRDEVIAMSFAPELDRVGVVTYLAGKYVSYRECDPTEAFETLEQLAQHGFTQGEYRP